MVSGKVPPRKKIATKKRRGMTLVEITLTLTIVALLAGVVFLAIDPAARLQESRYARALSEAKEIEKAIHLFANDVQEEPGWQPDVSIPFQGRMSRMNICMPGIASNITPDYCVNLDELVDEGFLPQMPIYEDPDGREPNVTGFSVYAHGGFWEVLPGQVFVPRSLNFDGTDDYVWTQIPAGYTGLDMNGPGAISLWVKPLGDQPNYAGLVLKAGAGSQNAGIMNYHIHANYFDGTWPNPSCDPACAPNCTDECSLPRCCVSGGSPPGCTTVTDPTNGVSCMSNDPLRAGGYTPQGAWNHQARFGLAQNKWQLIVFTWNTEKVLVYQYVEGEAAPRERSFDNPPDGRLPAPLPGQHLYIGARDATAPTARYFRGILDDVRLYDRYLKREEVVAMTNGTLEDDPIASLKQQFMFNDHPARPIVRADFDRTANGQKMGVTPQKDIAPPWVPLLRGCDQDAASCP